MLNKVVWLLTSQCNYNCWYCVRNYPNLTEIKKEDCFKIISFINKIFEGEKDKILYLNGGEPTISPYFFNVLDYVNFDKLEIDTNLSCSRSFLEDLMAYKKRIKYISATFHANYSDINTFLENIEYIHGNIQYQIRFTFENNNYDYIMEKYYTMFKEIRKKYPFQRVRISSGNNIYINHKILDVFRDKYTFIRIEDPINENFGNLLDCHQKFLTINYNGDIYQCITMIRKNYKLYNILKDEKESSNFFNIFYKTKLKCISKVCCKGL